MIMYRTTAHRAAACAREYVHASAVGSPGAARQVIVR